MRDYTTIVPMGNGDYVTVKDGRFIKPYDPIFDGSFKCNSSHLISLEGAPLYVEGDFSCPNNKLTSLEGIGKKYLRTMNGILYIYGNPIISHMLGILLVEGCTKIVFAAPPYNVEPLIVRKVKDIFSRHLEGDRDILECREELIANDLKYYAKL